MDRPIAFLLARITIATSFLGHGFIRLPKLQDFSNWMTGRFSASILPEAVVLPFSYILPFAEFVIGILLLAGLFTRGSLIAGTLLMIVLIFGSSVLEDWAAIPSQLIHAAFCIVLLVYVKEFNIYSLDKKFNRQS